MAHRIEYDPDDWQPGDPLWEPTGMQMNMQMFFLKDDDNWLCPAYWSEGGWGDRPRS